MRKCGDCTVCCYIGAVPDLKAPHTACHLLVAGKCSVYGKPERSSVCSGFRCSWLHGFLAEDDRPDKINVMFTMNRVDDKLIAFAIETAPDALRTTAAAALKQMARSVTCPIIGVSFGAKPPNDKGDWVIVRDEFQTRARAILGVEVWRDGDVGIYHFRRAA